MTTSPRIEVIPSAWPVGSQGWLADAEREEQRLADLLVRQWRYCDEAERAGKDVTEFEAKTVKTLERWMSAYDAMKAGTP